MSILNIDKYKRRLESRNPVIIEEFENELKVLIKEMIEAATQGEITTHLCYEKNEKSYTEIIGMVIIKNSKIQIWKNISRYSKRQKFN